MNLQLIQYNLLCGFCALLLAGCTTVTVDQVKHRPTELRSDESVVVIGRRSGSNYETEPELISCIGETLAEGEDRLNVIPEQAFVDRLYPWFEARTAPSHVKALQRLLSIDRVEQIIGDYNVHYIIWVDGNTENTRSSGSISCGLSGAGVSCFGFGTRTDTAEYEASIWDYRTKELIGKVSSVADGTSYIPAIVVPIPLIARVQSNACKAMAVQLRSFFKSTASPTN